jgi:small subunit ribosomal protein S16
MGKIHAPYYRVVIMNARTKRDGRAIEEIGKYHPTHDPSIIEIDSARVQYWLGVGAQPTEQVAALLKITGDWQTFKGLPGTEGTLRLAEPKADKTALYEAATQQAMSEPKDGATTKRKKAEPKADKADAKADKAEAKADKADAKAEPKTDKAEKAEPKADKASSAAISSHDSPVKGSNPDKAAKAEKAEPKAEKADKAPDVTKPEA